MKFEEVCQSLSQTSQSLSQTDQTPSADTLQPNVDNPYWIYDEPMKEMLLALREKLCGSNYDASSMDQIGIIGRNVAFHIHGECTSAERNRSNIEVAQKPLMKPNVRNGRTNGSR